MWEIEFRGKRKDNGEWVCGYYVKADSTHYIFTGRIGLSQVTLAHCLMYEDFERYEVIYETVGQYTGLKDKNGMRIFEGDIVKAFYFLKNQHYVGVIEYSDEMSAYILGKHKHPHIAPMASFGIPDTEVIGNIHDNPELLEKAP
jgi:uncharacterized phage protein (TIGR01671 family)